MDALDRRLRGWVIPPRDLEICRRADGAAWLLGAGGFGRVRTAALDDLVYAILQLQHADAIGPLQTMVSSDAAAQTCSQ